MTAPDSNFIAAKNAEESSIAWLYRVQVSDDPADDLFLAEARSDVSYFKDTSTAQVYSKFPIQHQGITKTIDGQAPTLQVVVGNVALNNDGTPNGIINFVELNAGLRGRTVTIRQVDLNHLSDPDAHSPDVVYTIDSVVYTTQSLTFSLRPKLGVMQIQLPRRVFARSVCPWKYKGRGCWIADVTDPPDQTFHSPDNFQLDSAPLWLSEVSASGSNSSPAACHRSMHPVDARGLNVSTDSLVIELKCSNPAKLTTNSQIEIGSGGIEDVVSLELTDITGLGITTSYQTFTIPLSGFTATTPGPDYAALNWFRIYSYFADVGPYTLSFRNAVLALVAPYGFTPDSLDTCNHLLADCQRHNNVARFGGFPNIPQRGNLFV